MNTKSLQIQNLISVCLFILAVISSYCKAQNLITINPGIKYQTMVGWDVMGQGGAQGDLFYQTNMENHYRNFRDTLVTLLVNEAGINMIQVELRCGQENPADYWQTFWENQDASSLAQWWSNAYVPVNDNDDPYSIEHSGFQFSELDSTIAQIVLPLRRRLTELRGENLYVYLNYIDFASTAFEHRADPDEYAEFIEAAIEHIYDTWGFYVDGVCIINEPDNGNDPGWSSGATVGSCAKALIDRIQSRGWDIDIIAPATLSMDHADNYFDNIWSRLADDDTSYFRLLAYHRYAGISSENLKNIEDRVSAHPLLGGFMNEWWNESNNHEILHEDLKNGSNSAWQQGVACSPFSGSKTPLYRVDTTQSPPLIFLDDKTKYTMLYYRYVRPGAVRIEATTNSDFDPVAFVNKNNKYVVIIKIESEGDFFVNGLPPGLYGIKYTTPLEYDVDLPDVTINEGEPLAANIPYEGVMTIYQKPIPGENNSPVKLDTIPNITFLEDNGPVSIGEDLNSFFLDPDDGDSLLFESLSDNNNISTAISNDTLIINSALNYFGIGNIIVIAIDNGGLSVRDTFSVRIDPVNDPPSLSNIPDLVFHQDSSFTIDLDTYATDVDNDTGELKWSATVLSAHLLWSGSSGHANRKPQRRPIKPLIRPSDLIIVIDSLNHHATFRTVNNILGWFEVELSVTDPGGLQASDVIKVTATPFITNSSPNKPTSIKENQTINMLPVEYSLYQNYPNPFNPLTTIEFQIPQKGHVQLTIYDLQGRKITTLVNDFMDIGYYNVEWDGTNSEGVPVASGIYIYQIATKQFNDVKKMLLIH